MNGYLDDVKVERIAEFQQKFLNYLETVDRKVLKDIKEKRELTPEIDAGLKEAIMKFKKEFGY